jgi:hypothetical protein
MEELKRFFGAKKNITKTKMNVAMEMVPDSREAQEADINVTSNIKFSYFPIH